MIQEAPPVGAGDPWRRVTAPGGYECRRLEAEDARAEILVVVESWEGSYRDSKYIGRYLRFMGNPTRRIPPVPAEFPCASLSVYERGRLIGGYVTRSPSHAMHRDPDCWRVQGPIIDLVFRPAPNHPPLQRSIGHHSYVIADAVCDVEGSVRVGARTIAIKCRGYHEHRFGTRALVETGRWMTGRLLLPGRLVAFQVDPIESAPWLAEIDEQGGRESLIKRVIADWSRIAKGGVRYPAAVQLDDAVRLSNPRVMEGCAIDATIGYDAVVRGQRGKAVCRVMHPEKMSRIVTRWKMGEAIEEGVVP